MKSTIYWFSSTGNSLVMARKLAAKLGDTDLVPMAAVYDRPALPSADRIGLVYPVYVWGLPRLVKDFIGRLPAEGKPYIYAVATYGGFPGGTNLLTAKLLRRRSLELAAGFGVRMPGNYTPMYGAISADRQQQQFAAAEPEIDRIAAHVQTGRPGPIKSSFFLANWIFTNLMYTIGSGSLTRADKNYHVEESCTGCGICARVCPRDNIELVDSRPVFRHNCEQCLACLQWCPEEAIQYKKSTKARKRYHHPDVTVHDFMVRGQSGE